MSNNLYKPHSTLFLILTIIIALLLQTLLRSELKTIAISIMISILLLGSNLVLIQIILLRDNIILDIIGYIICFIGYFLGIYFALIVYTPNIIRVIAVTHIALYWVTSLVSLSHALVLLLLLLIQLLGTIGINLYLAYLTLQSELRQQTAILKTFQYKDCLYVGTVNSTIDIVDNSYYQFWLLTFNGALRVRFKSSELLEQLTANINKQLIVNGCLCNTFQFTKQNLLYIEVNKIYIVNQ
jgi:hypothetical protein